MTENSKLLLSRGIDFRFLSGVFSQYSRADWFGDKIEEE